MKEFNLDDFNINNQLEVLPYQRAMESYYCKNFEDSNIIMARLVKNSLGNEAISSLNIVNDDKKEKLKKLFYDISLNITNKFDNSFNAAGSYLTDKESEFYMACDQEGIVAQKALYQAMEIIGINEISQQEINEVINNITVEDSLMLIIKRLRLKEKINEEQFEQIKQETLTFCKNPENMRNILAKVVPIDDYYYERIYREKKENDESILKFNDGKAKNDNNLKIIDLSLRLANATWFAAQRHCAKKDGNTDRINPDKRNGVFNTPDNRHIKQFQEALENGASHSEAVIRLSFELCKDAWMLED